MWLALDTATDRASLALGGPGEVVATEQVVGARRHAAALLPALEACLARGGVGYGAIEGIVLADGPGSFTGLRVGATVARALIRVTEMPMWTAPSLLVCARGAPAPSGETVLAVSNALRGDLFAAAYRFHPGAVETVLAPTVLRAGSVRDRVAAECVAGPAAAMLGAAPTWPDAAWLLALVGLAGGVSLVMTPEDWEPEYGRPAGAQVKWEQEHGRPLADSTGIHG